MKEVYFVADNIVSPLGKTTGENFVRIQNGVEGVKQHINDRVSPEPFYASVFDNDFFSDINGESLFTNFEKLLQLSVHDALAKSGIDPSDKNTILIISSTKGNISLLESGGGQLQKATQVSLHASAKKIADHFHFVHQPIVVSSACISGLVGLITAKRLLQRGIFQTAVVAGADLITSFIFSGFHSFQALSNEVCRPFDAARKGINLGEGAATVVLSTDPKYKGNIRLGGGAVSNDANHISGPSRTGEELFLSIQNAMNEAGVTASEIGFISAHGTATVYNDEMEAKAIGLAGLAEVPLNSLKGYFGHTLGAAGLIETIIASQSMIQGAIVPTPGYENSGVSVKVNVTREKQNAQIRHSIKTASGFGGCNAAIVLSK
jgi:3-oxoacyl-[acyl-carrier-protein] synthase-1